MKLISFNMNSINAYLKKGLLSQLEKYDFDILSIQELKMTEKEHDNFPYKKEGFTPYWTVSKAKKGYAGTAVLTSISPLNVTYGLEDNKYDDEGRVITVEYDSFYLVTLYVPNSGDMLKRLDYRMIFEDDLREYLSKLQKKKPIIVTGDMNVANENIDLKNPSSNHHSAGFTDEERGKLKKLLSIGLVDTFRHFHPDTVKYSYWSYLRNARKTNAGWRIDYYLVSQCLVDKVKEADILNDVFGSDHCPVYLDIDL